MARKMAVLVATATLSVSILLVAGIGTAGAVWNPPPLPGTVTCNPSGGVWSGVITFAPPLKNGGAASSEVFKIKATLGNTASACVTTAGFVALGKIKGVIKYTDPGTANNCATMFSGAALPSPVLPSKLKMKWTSPVGAPTKWTQLPHFVITGAANNSDITITGGAVAGSFTPFAGPTATLSDSTWPGVAGAVATGCASAGGLAALTLGTSSGSW
jgi:hypothetical protein